MHWSSTSTFAIIFALLASNVTSEPNKSEYWSLVTRAITDPSGEDLYNDYKANEAFIRQYTQLPTSFQQNYVDAPWEAPKQTTDAISTYVGLTEYIEARTAQEFGVFSDKLISAHSLGYAGASSDSDTAAIGVEIGVHSAKNIGKAYLAAQTGGLSTFLDIRPDNLGAGIKGNFVGAGETAFKMWASGAIRDNVLAPKTLEKYKNAIGHESFGILEAAQEEQISKGSTYLLSLQKLENSAERDEKGKVISARKATKRFVEKARQLKSVDDINQLKTLIEDGTDPEIKAATQQEKNNFEELLTSAKEYIASSEKVLIATNEVVGVLDQYGVQLSPDTQTALRHANGLSNAAGMLTQGNYFGAALGVIKLFGPQKPSAEQVRFQAIMGVLNRIDGKLNRVLDNQQKILQGQARIMSQLQRMNWSMEKGFQNLESSLQESTEIILKAVFAVDERNIGSCRVAADGIAPILFPDLKQNFDIFSSPNSPGLSNRTRLNWLVNPPTAETKLKYYQASFGRDLSRCKDALTLLFNGLQSGRQIDEYFFLSRLDSIDSTIQSRALQRSEDKAIEFAQAVSKSTQTAKGYRTELFGPAIEYYLDKMPALLRQINPELSEDSAIKGAVALAFEPHLVTSYSPASIHAADAKTKEGASRTQGDIQSNIERVETYFTDAIYSEFKRPLSPVTVSYAAKAMSDLHSILTLLDAHYGNSSIDLAPSEAALIREDQSLRLLLQSLQVVEIVRAQQAIVDGSGLVELIWNDLHSEDPSTWKQAQGILNRSSLIRENFSRFLIFRAATLHGEKGQYRTDLNLPWPRFIEHSLSKGLGPKFRIRVTCRQAPNNETCLVKDNNFYSSDFDIHINWSLESEDAKPLMSFRLPGSETVISRAFAREPSFHEMQALHDKLRKDIASYKMEAAIEEALSAEGMTLLAPEIKNLYAYVSNMRAGFERSNLGAKQP